MPALSSRSRVTRALLLVGGASSLAVAFVVACSSPSTSSSSGSTPVVESGTNDVVQPTPDVTDAGTTPTLDGRCADTFGAGLTEGFGRLDGVVYAVQKPSDTTCAMPNKD